MVIGWRIREAGDEWKEPRIVRKQSKMKETQEECSPQCKSLYELLVCPAHHCENFGFLLLGAIPEKTGFVRSFSEVLHGEQ